MANYAIFRRYYWTRNYLILVRDYFFIEPSWAMLILVIMTVSIVKVLMFEEDRFEKLKMIVFGCKDFLTKKMDRNVLPGSRD